MTKAELLGVLATRFYKVPEPEQLDEKFGIKEYKILPWAKVGDQIFKQYVGFCVENEGTPEEEAYWSGQEPMKPLVESFTVKAVNFVKAKIADGTIKYGYLISTDNEAKKGLAVAILPTNAKKDVLLTEDELGVLSITVL